MKLYMCAPRSYTCVAPRSYTCVPLVIPTVKQQPQKQKKTQTVQIASPARVIVHSVPVRQGANEDAHKHDTPYEVDR